MKKNHILFILTIALAFMMVACQSTPKETAKTQDKVTPVTEPGKEPEKTPATPPAPSDNKDFTVIQTGKLTLATNADFPPFEFISNEGLIDIYDGIDIAITMKLAEKMGLELVVENMEFGSLLGVLPAGKADIVAAGLSITEERLANMNFTEQYYVAKQVIVAPTDALISSVDDILPLRVGAIENFTGESIVRNTLNVKSVSTYKTGADAVMDILNGRIDALVLDEPTALALTQKNIGLQIIEETNSDVFEDESYAIGVSKDNEALLAALNAALIEMIDSGEVDEIIANYMQ